MKKLKGSFTIEAAYILPIILICFCIAVEVAITLHEDVRVLVEAQLQKKPMDMIESMYRRDLVKDIFGEVYEN